MTKHGWHWPREEQRANAFEEFGELPGSEVSAARVQAAWAPLIPPFVSPIDPERPEFGNVPDFYRGEEISNGREPEQQDH